ncbi:macro domain-containing protein [Streptomyces sp. NPDC051664]|uniref:macro domain-containing protein n=1 Tax=Streptomyces sp. NPDC051664 TaxID=3365668 RepID=UPI0037B7D3F2
MSGAVQLVLTVVDVGPLKGWRVLLALLALSVIWGIFRSSPKGFISREFSNPSFKVTVKKGDLFAETSQLVIGFTDTFDTGVGVREAISETSVQGQFARRLYSDDLTRLNRDLSVALRGKSIESVELRSDKPKGNLRRYPIGTVVTIGDERNYYCIAYSRLSNDLVARSSVDSLWDSMRCLWDEISMNGGRDRVSMPVIGSDLARVDNLDYESIVKMVTLSFVARSRQSVIAKELTIVVHPQDQDRLDMNEVRAFLYSL